MCAQYKWLFTVRPCSKPLDYVYFETTFVCFHYSPLCHFKWKANMDVNGCFANFYLHKERLMSRSSDHQGHKLKFIVKVIFNRTLNERKISCEVGQFRCLTWEYFAIESIDDLFTLFLRFHSGKAHSSTDAVWLSENTSWDDCAVVFQHIFKVLFREI